ncbi:hypothetical protein, partial [Nonomuraea basaltis]|uniref:hypothetical protein n=1 Tax=Nonomuraea basaltis TaxID=2495887 RepID=UPI00197CFDD7
ETIFMPCPGRSLRGRFARTWPGRLRAIGLSSVRSHSSHPPKESRNDQRDPGILLEQGNLFTDGAPVRSRPGKAGTSTNGHERGRASQSGSRFADLQHLAPFSIRTAEQQRTWMSLVRHFESNLILLDHQPNALTLHHWRYLHERTSGYIGALSILFKKAAHMAMDPGVEALTRDTLDRVVLGHDDEVDYAKTRARRQAAARRRTKKAPAPSDQDTGTG